MKKFYLILHICAAFGLLLVNKVNAQCTTANINWDYLDYLQTNSSSYSTYISTPALYTSMVQTQRFAIGNKVLTITHNYAATENLGENGSNTGEAGSYGSGDDVQFRGNGVITCTFDSAVANLKFSIYDIDRSQKVTITAFNGVTPVNVTMAKLSGSVLTIAGSGSPSASATATNTNVASTSTDGTINVDVTPYITSFVITVTSTGTSSQEDGSFWLSDISACVTGSFPTSYYSVSKPFTGQPAYVLAVHDLNTIYMVDPATGRAVSLFTDNSPRVREINDLAYDPHKRILYYSVDGLERCTPAGNPDSVKYMRKYDFNTETISQVIDNINNAPLNIPSFSYGLESAAGAFYGGSLYTGVEGTKSGSVSTGREGIIWRIDFASDSITPVRASQVFALPADNGSAITHDWGDIAVKDGVLYDFNSSTASGNGTYNVLDLMTKSINSYAGLQLTDKPRQVGQQWNGNLVWLHDSVTAYNGTNVLTLPKKKIVPSYGSVTWVAGAGDAAEAFRPKADFGDAPASFDPNPLSPAMHEKDSTLFIGTSFGAGWDWEWSKQTSSDATGDGADDNDGLSYVPVFDKSTNAYSVQVRVYNNNPSKATLIGWLDYNNNGVFDPGEASTSVLVDSLPTVQSKYLNWPSITSTVPNGTFIFLRIRLTSVTNSMTSANPTGYFNNGEVEDYRVYADKFPLSATLLSFEAKPVNNSTARLTWTTVSEINFEGFDIERSADGVNWSKIGFVKGAGSGQGSTHDYVFNDVQALKGKSFYRLKLIDYNNASMLSEIRTIQLKDLLEQVSLIPNPAKTTTSIYINSTANTSGELILSDMQGRRLKTQNINLIPGNNSIVLDGLYQYPNGTYFVQVVTGQETVTRKLVIGNQIF